jgi:ribosome-associated protein
MYQGKASLGLAVRPPPMARIPITADISIDDGELDESFVQASGPGGQNVNKVATAVQLRFDVARSPSLPDEVRRRLVGLGGKRITKDGVLVLVARQFRTQERNRDAARERLIELIRRASVAPKPRHATRVPRASKRRRVDDKKARARVKRTRARPGLE